MTQDPGAIKLLPAQGPIQVCGGPWRRLASLLGRFLSFTLTILCSCVGHGAWLSKGADPRLDVHCHPRGTHGCGAVVAFPGLVELVSCATPPPPTQLGPQRSLRSPHTAVLSADLGSAWCPWASEACRGHVH